MHVDFRSLFDLAQRLSPKLVDALRAMRRTFVDRVECEDVHEQIAREVGA